MKKATIDSSAAILRDSEAMPIVKKWISEAVESINTETGVTLESDFLLSRLANCDWIICGGYAEGDEPLVDMEITRRALDNIVKQEIKYIYDEKRAELESSLTRISENILECNGLWIEFNCYGNNEYSVQFFGDDLLFDSLETAASFCMSQK